MKRVACCSEMSECGASPVVVAQLSALLRGGNLCEEADLVVRFDLALLLVKETVDLTAGCSIQKRREADKDTCPPIHSCSETLSYFISNLPACKTYAKLSYLYFHKFVFFFSIKLKWNLKIYTTQLCSLMQQKRCLNPLLKAT